MAKAKKPKTSSGARNPERKNGKAWTKDKNKPAKEKTHERMLADFLILQRREARKEENRAIREAREAYLARQEEMPEA